MTDIRTAFMRANAKRQEKGRQKIEALFSSAIGTRYVGQIFYAMAYQSEAPKRNKSRDARRKGKFKAKIKRRRARK